MRVPRILAAALAVLVTVGCAGPPTAGGGPTPAQSPAALNFEATTLAGQPVRGADLVGRPALLWFWAPWCATCAGQAGSVADLAAEYGDRLTVLGVPGMGDKASVRGFVAEFELEAIPQLDDTGGALWRRFEVTEQSTYVLLDREGRMVHRGWLDDLALTDRVARLVG